MASPRARLTAGQPPTPPGAGPASPGPGQPKPGTIAAAWKKHPWWFIAGGGAVVVVLWVWHEHSKQSQQGKQGARGARRTVIFRGGGRGDGDHDDHRHRNRHHKPHGHPKGAADVNENEAPQTDEANLLQQVDALQSALADYTEVHKRDHSPGGAGPAVSPAFPLGGPGAAVSSQMTPQPF